jgi:hypothetical protein
VQKKSRAVKWWILGVYTIMTIKIHWMQKYRYLCCLLLLTTCEIEIQLQKHFTLYVAFKLSKYCKEKLWKFTRYSQEAIIYKENSEKTTFSE